MTTNSTYNDAELLRAIQQGDQQAFTMLYYKYHLPLSKKALGSLWDITSVEEVVHNVFVALWDKAASLEHTDNVRAWLYQSLKYEVLNMLRTERRREYYQHQFTTLANEIDMHSPADEAETKELYEKVMKAISTLPEQARRAYVLSRFENMSYREIAEQMNLSVSTVEKHVIKALQILRETMKEHELAIAVILLAVNLNDMMN